MNTVELIKRVLELNELTLEVLCERDNPERQLGAHDANRICAEMRAEIREIKNKIGEYH